MHSINKHCIKLSLIMYRSFASLMQRSRVFVAFSWVCSLLQVHTFVCVRQFIWRKTTSAQVLLSLLTLTVMWIQIGEVLLS